MIDEARREHPALRFEVGSMADLPLADASVAGRALRPGGPLLLGFHVGETSRLKTEGYGGHPMKVYVHRRQPAQVAAALRDAGFSVEAHVLLDLDGSRPGAILFARR